MNDALQPPSEPSPSGGGKSELNQWAVITHLAGLAGMLIPLAGNIVGPLIVWLVKKPELPGLDAVGRDVLNFQVSWSIWLLVASAIGFAGSCLVVPLVLPLGFGIAWLVLTIIGAVRASDGQRYAFPLTLKLF